MCRISFLIFTLLELLTCNGKDTHSMLKQSLLYSLMYFQQELITIRPKVVNSLFPVLVRQKKISCGQTAIIYYIVKIYNYNIKDIKRSPLTPNCFFLSDSGELDSRLVVI